MTRAEQMLSTLKKNGKRITPQRIAVVQILAESTDHPSVDQLYAKVRKTFPATGLATVYKTVLTLKELGEVMELGFGTGSSHYDGREPRPHPHLICTGCQVIMDAEFEAMNDLARTLASRTGFRIDHHRLDFFGRCPQCQQAAKTEKS